MPDWTTITLAIKESAYGDSFSFHLYVDAEPVATNRTLSPKATQAQRELSEDYLSWFEQHKLPLVEEHRLTALGEQLFETWLAAAWEDIKDELLPTARRRFVVASDVPAVLNLPWSLLRLPGEEEPIGVDPMSSVRLHPALDRLTESKDELRPGPLRVLYSACAPRDAVDLGYEREEYQLLRTLSQRDRVAHFGCDLGAFDELQDRVREYRPHVVHLTGHGVVDDGDAYFAFEDEKGCADPRPGNQIVNDALAGRDVQCMFVSGCETGQAPEVEAINGLCQSLVTNGVPLAAGWAASILDDVATAFGNTFYAELSAGEDVDRAVVQARRDARNLCRGRTEEDGAIDPSWTLPVLYTATTQAALFDPHRHEAPPKPSVEQRPLPGMTEGHADYFIGRRREQQKLLPDLRTGDLNTVLLTGLGGVGKSTLATRLARALQKDGFVPIAVPSTDDNSVTAGRLIDRCYEAFLAEDTDGPYPQLRSEEIDLRDKLRLLVQILNRNQFTLVLDNFERNVDRETHEILNDDLAWFLPHLVEYLTELSRCLVTSRYRPADLGDDLPPVATELSLADFPESAFFKYLLDDETVRQRYRSGDLPRDLLSRVYELLGGTPRFLEQVREAIQDMPADELEDALDAVDLPEDADENRLREIRDEYVEDLFIQQLYAAIEPPEARTALSRAAVYTIPMTAEGYAAAADADEADVRDWLDTWRRHTFVAPVETGDGDLERWVIPTLLRPWLLEQIDRSTRCNAHEAAGTLLRDLIEAERTAELDLKPLEVGAEAQIQNLEAGRHEEARQITTWMSETLERYGFYSEIIRLNRKTLDFEVHPMPLNWIGVANIGLKNFKMARRQLGRALNLSKEHGDVVMEAGVRNNMAMVEREEGNLKDAREQLEEVLSLTHESEQWGQEARARHAIAMIAVDLGQFSDAEEQYDKALPIMRKIGDRRGEAGALHTLGMLAYHRGDYSRARERLREALSIFREVDDRRGEAAVRHQLGTFGLERGDYSRARKYLEEALPTFQEITDEKTEATIWHQLATVDLLQGKHSGALKKYVRALKIRQTIGDSQGEAVTFGQLGIFAKQGRGEGNKGLKFQMISFWIHQECGHRKAKEVEDRIHNLADELGYTQEDFDTAMQEAIGAYAQDRGWSLIQEAFPDADIPNDVPPHGDSE
jgi:tetratricopeptide (TPR) repeat protein